MNILYDLPEHIQYKINKLLFSHVLYELCDNFKILNNIKEKHVKDVEIVKALYENTARHIKLCHIRWKIYDDIKDNKSLLKLYVNDGLKYKFLLDEYLYTLKKE